MEQREEAQDRWGGLPGPSPLPAGHMLLRVVLPLSPNDFADSFAYLEQHTRESAFSLPSVSFLLSHVHESSPLGLKDTGRKCAKSLTVPGHGILWYVC